MPKSKQPRPLTKPQLVSQIAQAQGITKSQAESILNGIGEIAKEQLGTSGPGVFVIPGVVKLRAVTKAATPERKGFNPLTKQPITIAAKPATRKVRALATKALKEAVI